MSSSTLMKALFVSCGVFVLSTSATADDFKFKVQNLCSKPVQAAVGWAVPYDGKKAPWAAKGWITIKPGQTKVLYRGKNEEVYVHLNEVGETDHKKFAQPDHYLHQTSFCVAPGEKFYTVERIHERTQKSEFRVGEHRKALPARANKCDAAGGKPRDGFYLMKSQHTWVYTCPQGPVSPVAAADAPTKVVTETIVVQQKPRPQAPTQAQVVVTKSIPYSEHELPEP